MLGDDAGAGFAEGDDYRAHPGQSVFHGRDGAGAVRPGRAGARRARCRLAKPLTSIQIPSTVKGILAARIDKLAPADKDLLQSLAVIGKEFPIGLVRRVVGKPDDELAPMLANLQAAEFIYEQPAFPENEYTFKHALTQEVAYDSVLMQRRRTIHERTATALEEMFAATLDDHVADLAHHYSRSANAPKAIEYLRRAAEQAGSAIGLQRRDRLCARGVARDRHDAGIARARSD